MVINSPPLECGKDFMTCFQRIVWNVKNSNFTVRNLADTVLTKGWRLPLSVGSWVTSIVLQLCKMLTIGESG